MSFAPTKEKLSAAAIIATEIRNQQTPALARILRHKCFKMLASVGVLIKNSYMPDWTLTTVLVVR
jgi:hypothetical protein